MVSSEAFAVRRTLLDERLDGDDDTFSLGSRTSLRLGHQQVSTSNGNDCCFPWNDVEQHLLGKSKRQIWQKTSKFHF